MEPIRFNISSLGSVGKRKKGSSTIIFKSNPVAGYVPLLKLFQTTTRSNDFLASSHRDYSQIIVSRMVKLQQWSYISFPFRTNMRRTTTFNNPLHHMVISLMSVLTTHGRKEETFNFGTRRFSRVNREKGPNPFKAITMNPVDVIILAMIKTSDIGKIKYTRYDIEIDPTLITLFVSEEKYQNREFLKENYNGSVATYLRKEVGLLKQLGVKVEVVPDNILGQYYSNPYSIETNSIFEIMEIDTKVKEKVFSNIKEKLFTNDD